MESKLSEKERALRRVEQLDAALFAIEHCSDLFDVIRKTRGSDWESTRSLLISTIAKTFGLTTTMAEYISNMRCWYFSAYSAERLKDERANFVEFIKTL